MHTLSPDLLRSRSLDAEDGNGLELWRTYFDKAKGISQEVDHANFRRLLNFPQASSERDLSTKVPQWMKMFSDYGSGISESKKIALFINILPDHLQRKFSVEYSFKNFRDIYNHVDKLILYDSHHKLATRDPNQRLHVIGDAPKGDASGAQDALQRVAAAEARVDEALTAIGASGATRRTKTRGDDDKGAARRAKSPASRSPGRGRRPHPDYKGCWHCGDDEHPNKQCPKYRSMVEKHKGRPKHYKSMTN